MSWPCWGPAGAYVIGASVRARLQRLLDAARASERPLTSVVLGRRALLGLQRELGLTETPTHYGEVPIRVRADYASYVGVEGPLAAVRPDCGCAACQSGFAHEAACRVHEGTCRRCGRLVKELSPKCRAHAGACICGRPIPTR